MAVQFNPSALLRALAPIACLIGGVAQAEVPNTPESIEAGRALFISNCTQCHGNDGKAMVDVISDATDLTEPELYRNGSTDADIIRSITEGVGGVMPAYATVFNSETDIENLKNFITSLWPADQRPAVE